MLSSVGAALQRFAARLEREEGQALAEYGLILALVALACVVVLGVLAISIIVTYADVTAALP